MQKKKTLDQAVTEKYKITFRTQFKIFITRVKSILFYQNCF